MITPEQKAMYLRLRAEGWSQGAASEKCGFSRWTAVNLEKVAPNTPARLAQIDGRLPKPRPVERLNQHARRALDDFGYFRHRYMARRSTPWQEQAAHRVTEWLATPQTEFVVQNCPPGSGKTTLWTDILTWCIVRDRTIRAIWLSHTYRLATQPVNRVRRILERPRPVTNAEGCLAHDYGRFRPINQDLWKRDEFMVVTLDEQPQEDKEPTVAAYGMDSEFLGHRGQLVIGDDLVTGSIQRSIERIENQQRWWSEEGETRTEPGGLCVLNGQRMHSQDLYRFALDQKLEDTQQPRYEHIVYPAHVEAACKGSHHDNPDHELKAKPWPDGCLLDPVRLPWKGPGGLLTKQHNRNEVYRVQYQQEDSDPKTVLVPMIWVTGGRDHDGYEYPGCWDNHRGIAEPPKGLSPPVFSIASADPSPSKFWAIEWWLYHPASEQRFLMDLIREAMDAPEFLDWNENQKQFFGIMEDWQGRSRRLGHPITHWIIENNAAQRWLLSQSFIQRWQSINNAHIIGHSTTGKNKLDPDYGVQMLANRYRFGNVRLPGRHSNTSGLVDPGRLASLKLVDEVTKYDGTNASTDDCIMAQWFFEYNLPGLAKIRPANQPRQWRPSFMRTA